MPISHKHKAILVHIPKAGGSSIEKAMGIYGTSNKGYNSENGDKKAGEIMFGWSPEKEKPYQHFTALEIKEYVGEEIFNKYYKFTVVRNPFDKIVSDYIWQRKNKEMSFKDFLIRVVMPQRTKAHHMEQVDYITDKDGNCLVDFIGRFENLSEDVEEIFRKLGIKGALPHVMKGKSRYSVHYSEFYDAETKKLVEEMFARDIKRFGYTFEIPSKAERVVYAIKKIKVPFMLAKDSILSFCKRSLSCQRGIKKAFKHKSDQLLCLVSGRNIAHFLHPGKTGGSALKEALKDNKTTPSFRIELHDHSCVLKDIPKGEKVFFFVREPLSRFVSSFNSRKRMGRPKYNSPWSTSEQKVFNRFSTPNELALALSSEDEEVRTAAEDAMKNIRHVKTSYWHWFGDKDYFPSRLEDILYIGFQETLDDDLESLKKILELGESVRLPEDEIISHKTPEGFDRHLDDKARENLAKWYAQDIEFYKMCADLSKKINGKGKRR